MGSFLRPTLLLVLAGCHGVVGVDDEGGWGLLPDTDDETDAADTDPTDTDPVETDVEETDETDLVDTDLVETDVVDTDPPVETDPPDTDEPGDTDTAPVDSEPPDTEPPDETDPPEDTDTAPVYGDTSYPWPEVPADPCEAIIPADVTVVKTDTVVTQDDFVGRVCRNTRLSLSGRGGIVFVEDGGEVMLSGGHSIVYTLRGGQVVVAAGAHDVRHDNAKKVQKIGGSLSETICAGLSFDLSQGPPGC